MQKLREIVLRIIKGHFVVEYVNDVFILNNRIITKIKNGCIKFIDKFRKGEPAYHHNM